MITHYQNSIYVTVNCDVTQEVELDAWEKAQAYANERNMGDIEFVETERDGTTSKLIFHADSEA